MEPGPREGCDVFLNRLSLKTNCRIVSHLYASVSIIFQREYLVSKLRLGLTRLFFSKNESKAFRLDIRLQLHECWSLVNNSKNNLRRLQRNELNFYFFFPNSKLAVSVVGCERVLKSAKSATTQTQTEKKDFRFMPKSKTGLLLENLDPAERAPELSALPLLQVSTGSGDSPAVPSLDGTRQSPGAG